MLVSAISATQTQMVKSVNYTYVNSRGGENANETVVPNYKKANATDDNADVYKSINEWKAFCHKRIAEGKLNIIA